jgi:hypothetical protein
MKKSGDEKKIQEQEEEKKELIKKVETMAIDEHL